MSGGVPVGEAHDPGTPAYEAARLTIAAELRRIAVDEPKSGYREMADRLMKGEQYEIPSWLAMVLLARATPAPPIEGRDADVERVVASYVKACDLGTEYHPTDWERQLIADGIRQYVDALKPTEAMINAARKAITDRYYSGGNVVQITPIKPREMAELVLLAALQALGERG